MTSWEKLQRSITTCQKCPRLREHCQTIATEKRRAFAEWTYWGKPIPNLGPPNARLLLVGLAPAAVGWLVACGVVYTAGVPVLALDRPGLWPGRNRAHGVWHLFVLAGSACHFVLIWHFVARAA